MTALTAPQLLKMEDGEFDAKIKEMSVKNLINTITLVQKEMSREQENFNSLTSELLSVKKNSGQYKSISKEMTVSQTRLTLLMNRSMKCFSQQGKQQNKAATDKKNSFQEAQTKGNAESRKSEPVKPTIVTQKPLESKDQFKRHSDIVQSSSNILVQSLKSSSPVMKLKTTNNVNGSGGVNGAPGVPVVRSSSPMSQRITSDITSKSQVRSNNLDKVKAHLNVKNENDSLKVAVQPKTESLSNSGATLGPMAEQRNKYMSKSSDNVFKKTTPHKTEIVKGITSTKPRSTVVMNADKQMMDLDMFTERKTMMDELKKFDQTLKPRTARTHSDKVTEVKLNLAKSGDTRSSANIEPKLSSTSVEHKGNVLGDIKLGKRPSELKQTKTVNFRTEQNVNERNDNEMKVPQVVKSTKETVAPKVPENHSQSKLFDDLLYCVESDKSDQSSENSPREATTDAVLEQKQKIENTISQILETSTVAKLGTVNDDIPVTGEITLEVTRDSTHATEASDDSLSQSSGTSEEDDTFVTEFHFTGSPLKTPVAEAAIPKKRGKLIELKIDIFFSCKEVFSAPARFENGMDQIGKLVAFYV